jgi:hypothetical protein
MSCQEIRARYGDEIKDNLGLIIKEGMEALRDRINNGDYILGKDGKLKRRPMSGRDLTIATGTMFDKLRILEGQPTQIVQNTDLDMAIKLTHLKAAGWASSAGKESIGSQEEWWSQLSEKERGAVKNGTYTSYRHEADPAAIGVTVNQVSLTVREDDT